MFPTENLRVGLAVAQRDRLQSYAGTLNVVKVAWRKAGDVVDVDGQAEQCKCVNIRDHAALWPTDYYIRGKLQIPLGTF